jgi:DNA-binding NarL/FixJ family response regulator
MTTHAAPKRNSTESVETAVSEWTSNNKEGDVISSPESRKVVVIIDRRALFRECLARCLESVAGEYVTTAFSTVQEWQLSAAQAPTAALVLLCVGAHKAHDEGTNADIALLRQRCSETPILLLSDDDDPVQVLSALDSGIRGYIPTSMSLGVAIEAMHLVRAGGTYIPATSLLSWRHSVGRSLTSTPSDHVTGFTSRQTAVLRALREGKANKIIAFELNMRESTVKVHVRNIMKRLNARNRTEVAFKTRDLFGDKLDHSSAAFA